MKKMYLVKGMAALAMGLVAVSCNKASFDEGAYQNAKEQESQEQFVNNVMGGQQIDPNQNWKTTNTIELTVTSGKEGTLKIYPANPIGNTTGSLYTINVTAGQTVTFNVTKGVDLTKLYAAVVDANNFILDMLTVDATAEKAEVNMGVPETRAAGNNRSADRNKPTQPDYDTTNPIAEPSAPAGMPTADNADFKVTSNSSVSWTYKNVENKTIYIAPSVTLTITGGEWDGFGKGCKVYMSQGSKIVTSTKLNLIPGVVIYNDGGTIEASGLLLEECTIWNKGTLDVGSNDLSYSDNGNGSKVYNSGTITAKDFQVGQNGLLWNVGTVTASGTLKGNNGYSKIYNGNIITVGGLELNNNSQYLWNDGTLTVNGSIYWYNSNAATIVNHGTIRGEKLDGKAGGHFFNSENCLVEISGATEITNSNSVWVNDGTYKSGTFKVSAGGNQVFNNCRLTVTGKFTMGNDDGSIFVLNGQASVICDSFDWVGDNYFWMGGGSILKVANTLKSNNKNDRKGFFNTTGEYAVITAKAITTDNEDSQWRARYEGKIYVDTDSHFEFKSFTQDQKNYYLGDGAVMTGKQGSAPLDWDESPCRPAYHGGGGRIESTIYYYYAFEDLGAIGDFDFNDVVLRLSAPESNQSTVQVMAAGGTLPVQVTYDGTNLGGEVHGEFDEDTGVMINTGKGTEKDPIELGVVNIAANADMANLPFGIVVSGAGSIKVTNEVDHTGEAPLMIVVSGYPSGDDAGKWFWPREYMNISKAYTQFGAWGANVQSNTNWYHHYTEGNVWKY